VLTDADAASRRLLLAELQAALNAIGVRSILAGNHRLVLRNEHDHYEPSGPTDPQLHVLTAAGTRVATTEGTRYTLTSGPSYPASDPAAAATRIAGHQPAAT
jgi:hypothetical protein